jgi:hypothetical protein
MRKKGSHLFFCGTKTADARLFQPTGGKQLDEVFWLRYCAIVKSLKTSSRKNFKRTCRFTGPRKSPESESILAGDQSLRDGLPGGGDFHGAQD